MMPLPHPNADSRAYWEGTALGELRYQRCSDCGHAQFPPRAVCLRCAGALQWARSAGQGSIHSYTVVARAPSAAFKSAVPYVLVLVDMDEGFRLLLTLRGPQTAPTISQRVRVVFEATEDPAICLPQAVQDGD